MSRAASSCPPAVGRATPRLDAAYDAIRASSKPRDASGSVQRYSGTCGCSGALVERATLDEQRRKLLDDRIASAAAATRSAAPGPTGGSASRRSRSGFLGHHRLLRELTDEAIDALVGVVGPEAGSRCC